MATFSCLKCALLFPSYAVCYAHLLDTPAHDIDRAAATAEGGRRGFRSAIEGMMTILISADATVTHATIVHGRDVIQAQATPLPPPLPVLVPRVFLARVKLRSMHRYTPQPAPAALRSSYDLLLRLPVALAPPSFMMLIDAVVGLFEAAAGDGCLVIWWGLIAQTVTAVVWTPELVVRSMAVRSDGGVKRMLDVVAFKELHSLVLGVEEE